MPNLYVCEMRLKLNKIIKYTESYLFGLCYMKCWY